MTIEYLQVLLATAEEMVTTASTPPEGAGRDEALHGPDLCFEYRSLDECRGAPAEGKEVTRYPQTILERGALWHSAL
jgi:hypothetical protein